MSDNSVLDINGTMTLVFDPEGAVLASVQDFTDAVGAAWFSGASLVAIPAARLAPEFFVLSSGLAGEATQKFVTYGIRLAVVGDIAAELEKSRALRDYVTEANRGHHVWFVQDLASLTIRLA